MTGFDKRESPADPSRDDEAFAAAEQRPAQQQEADRHRRHRNKGKGEQVEQPRCSRREKACNYGPLASPVVGKAAGPDARDDSGRKLAASNQADHECSKAKALVDVQGQHWQGDADNRKPVSTAPMTGSNTVKAKGRV